MTDDRRGYRWRRTESLPRAWKELTDGNVEAHIRVWEDRRKQLEGSKSYQEFLVRLRRQWAIETGAIERLYSISEAASLTLIEKGLDAAFLSHGDTDIPGADALALIHDQHAAIEGLYQFIAEGRILSKSYLRELHATLTAHQQKCEAIDSLGRRGWTTLLRGTWKTQSNNLVNEQGEVVFEFCPPEQVDSEIEHLVARYAEHEKENVPPHILAAWLHHEFVLIHPFQDGNGRVARCLATLVLLKQRWFPLVVTGREKVDYIASLRAADSRNLAPLVEFFGQLQKRQVRAAIDLGEDVSIHGEGIDKALGGLEAKLEKRRKQHAQLRKDAAKLADALLVLATERLTETKNTLAKRFGDQNISFNVDGAARNTERSGYNRGQTIEFARRAGYRANFEAFQGWALLRFTVDDVYKEILLAFHGLGRDQDGIFACAAITYDRAYQDDTAKRRVGDVVSIQDEPFDFTWREDPKAVEKRFDEWLGAVIVRGIELWTADL